MKTLTLLLGLAVAAPLAHADISDPGNLTLGDSAIVQGSMTVTGAIGAPTIALSTTGPASFALTASTGIQIENGPINLGSGAYIQWPDGTTSTTAAADGVSGAALLAATQTFSGANTFTSSVTVRGSSVFTSSAVVGAAAIAPGLVFETAGTTGGVLLSSMTNTQMNAIAANNLSSGTLIFNTTNDAYYTWLGSSWVALGGGSGGGGGASPIPSTNTWLAPNYFAQGATSSSDTVLGSFGAVFGAFASSAVIGGSSIPNSVVFMSSGTHGGSLLNPMTQAQESAISSSTISSGTEVFDLTTNEKEIWNGQGWMSAGSMVQIGTMACTTSCTWIKPPGVNTVTVFLVGGGGGGGGSGTANTYNASGGGGGGAVVYSTFSVAFASAGYKVPIAIGAGGTAGTTTPTSGGAGGSTSFGPWFVASGGGYGGNSLNTAGGTGGSGGGGGVYSNGGACAGGGGGGPEGPAPNIPATSLASWQQNGGAANQGFVGAGAVALGATSGGNGGPGFALPSSYGSLSGIMYGCGGPGGISVPSGDTPGTSCSGALGGVNNNGTITSPIAPTANTGGGGAGVGSGSTAETGTAGAAGFALIIWQY